MNNISSILFKSSVNPPTKSTNTQTQNNRISKPTQIILGTSLTAMAVGGIYIASKGRGISVDKAFQQIQNASSYMETLKNIKMQPKNFKQLMFKITSEEKTSEKFIKEVI